MDSGTTCDLAAWWAKDLRTHLIEDDLSRMMIMEEDGWISILEMPEDRCDVDAAVITAASGVRSLYYDLSLTMRCMCAHFRHREGAMRFDLVVKVSNVDNTNEDSSKDWVVDVALLDSRQQGLSRVQRFMSEYAYPRYPPHLRGLIKKAIARLRHHARELVEEGGTNVGDMPADHAQPVASDATKLDGSPVEVA